MACDNYKELTANACPDAFIVQANLVATTDYYWEFKDKFNVKYRGQGITDGDGILTIPVDAEATGLVKDMFQPFSGAFEFRLYAVTEEGAQEAFLFCNLYEFLVIVFEKVIEAPDPNNAELIFECLAL